MTSKPRACACVCVRATCVQGVWLLTEQRNVVTVCVVFVIVSLMFYKYCII